MTNNPGRPALPVARRRRIEGRSARVSRRVGTVATVLAGTGVLSLVLYATRCAEPLSVIGAGLLVTGAVAAVGAGLGFLFGVPRALAAQPEGTPPQEEARPAYAANTNLEQVSDWLTKLLIGAGLTQLDSLARLFKRLCRDLAPGFGARADSAVFAGALTVEFLILGFLSGWLVTRLLLASALSEADSKALQSFVEAETLSDRGRHDEADTLRALALEQLGSPQREAQRYDELRRRLPSGSHRTIQLQAVVDAARASARDSGLGPEQVKEFFGRGSEGERVYALALMQGAPDPAHLDAVLDSLTRSRSAFEQYQSLVAAELLTPYLAQPERNRLAAALRTQLAPGGFVARSSERSRLAERILRVLETADEAEPGA
ncbi:hypothetical protein [Streptomyces morookaense]|uniref:Uncharacterized protein n=1 Tax=Streptomyces morookaense TaxID=1970 RepID=A0A7Y7E8S3_STRMO|nr:hypothetical protein [Streptomyces morookaense]NVK80340.1 hypothetical protein [Streptomyces morookaense]